VKRLLVVLAAALAVAVVVVSPAAAGAVTALCTSTTAAVQTSPSYAALSPFQKLVANAVAMNGCNAVAAIEPSLTLAQKEALVARYTAAVAQLASAGLVTPAQAAALTAQAEAVVNPVTITSIGPNPTVICAHQTFVITGTGFVAGTTVDMSPWNMESVTVDSPTQLTVVTAWFTDPSQVPALGPLTVTVTTPAGSASATITIVSFGHPNGGCLAPE
jgi:hypothetical protein